MSKPEVAVIVCKEGDEDGCHSCVRSEPAIIIGPFPDEDQARQWMHLTNYKVVEFVPYYRPIEIAQGENDDERHNTSSDLFPR